MKYPSQTWCRAYFTAKSKCYMVDNNISECFNSWILGARHKPIITMLKDIRIQAMTRITTNKTFVDRWYNKWSPTSMPMLADNKELASGCRIIFNRDGGYEIREGDNKHTVLLDRNSCTCRAWDLTGIPFHHAIYALYLSKIDPTSRISQYYHRSTYTVSYTSPLLPVPGKNS
ncbi:hypothetical protein DITRI_Ditri03aG0093200 [Diplodiscus trichospermus]